MDGHPAAQQARGKKWTDRIEWLWDVLPSGWGGLWVRVKGCQIRYQHIITSLGGWYGHDIKSFTKQKAHFNSSYTKRQTRAKSFLFCRLWQCKLDTSNTFFVSFRQTQECPTYQIFSLLLPRSSQKSHYVQHLVNTCSIWIHLVKPLSTLSYHSSPMFSGCLQKQSKRAAMHPTTERKHCSIPNFRSEDGW